MFGKPHPHLPGTGRRGGRKRSSEEQRPRKTQGQSRRRKEKRRRGEEENERRDKQCPVCACSMLGERLDVGRLFCGHTVCKSCVARDKQECPMCRRSFKEKELLGEVLAEGKRKTGASGEKLEGEVEERVKEQVKEQVKELLERSFPGIR